MIFAQSCLYLTNPGGKRTSVKLCQSAWKQSRVGTSLPHSFLCSGWVEVEDNACIVASFVFGLAGLLVSHKKGVIIRKLHGP